MKRILLISFFAVAVFALSVRGDLLLAFNTFGNSGSETSEPSSANDSNILPSSLSAKGITFASNGNRYGGSSWNLTQSVDATNDYIEVSLAAAGGFTFSVTNIQYVWDRSGTGPTNVALRSNLDSFASDIFVNLGVGSMQGWTNTITGIDNQSSLTFRFYGYGATGGTGTGGFDTSVNAPNLSIFGTTVAVPEPSTSVLMGLTMVGLAVARRYRRSGVSPIF